MEFIKQIIRKTETTREELARETVADYEEESQCHYNNIVMLMRAPEPELLLCQTLVYLRNDNSFFYPHTFIIHPVEGYYLDYSKGRKDYLRYSLVRFVRENQFKRTFIYDRKKVLYWMNRKHWFAPFDTDLDLLIGRF